VVGICEERGEGFEGVVLVFWDCEGESEKGGRFSLEEEGVWRGEPATEGTREGVVERLRVGLRGL
jgi:hypothetical protein